MEGHNKPLLVHNKCFKSNIEVLLADGSSKQISEIIVGDVLIGGNGEPNTVTKDDSISIGSYGRQPNWYGFNGKSLNDSRRLESY